MDHLPGTRRQNRSLPRLLFLAVACWFPVQFGIVHSLGEVYPALVMPPFRYGGVRVDEEITLLTPEFVARFSKGPEAYVSASELAKEIPEPARVATISGNFGPNQLHQPETVHRESEASTSSALPGRGLMWERLADPSRAFKARNWLAARFAKLFPGRVALSVTVRWYERTIRPSGSLSAPRLVTEVMIPLREVEAGGAADDSTSR
jgi:hypothetical protein